MAIGVVGYLLYGRKHSLVQRGVGGGLELTQEEIKATWQAERDSGWVGDRQTQRTGGSSPSGAAGPGAQSRTGTGEDTSATSRSGPDRPTS